MQMVKPSRKNQRLPGVQHAQSIVGLDGRPLIFGARAIIAALLQPLIAKIFDRLIVQQAVNGARPASLSASVSCG